MGFRDGFVNTFNTVKGVILKVYQSLEPLIDRFSAAFFEIEKSTSQVDTWRNVGENLGSFIMGTLLVILGVTHY